MTAKHAVVLALSAALALSAQPARARSHGGGGGHHGGSGGSHVSSRGSHVSGGGSRASGGGHAVPRGGGSLGVAASRHPRAGSFSAGRFGYGGGRSRGYFRGFRGSRFSRGYGYPYLSFGFGWPYYDYDSYYYPYYPSYYGGYSYPGYAYLGDDPPYAGDASDDSSEQAPLSAQDENRGYDDRGSGAARSQHSDAGRLLLDVRPADASVYVDDEFWGNAGDTKSLILRSGRHTIEVVRPGFEVARREVEVARGETANLTFELQHR